MTRLLTLLACFLLPTIAAAGLTIDVTPDRETGVYDAGQTVTWKIEVKNSDGPAPAGTVNYRVLSGGLNEISSGSIPLENGVAQVQSSRKDPGVLLLRTSFTPTGTKTVLTEDGGAVFSPKAIKESQPLPDDFDQFWKEKLAELAAVPMNAQLEKIDIGNPEIAYYKITFDNIRGKKIQGQLAKPAGKTNLPAMLQVQYAGVYPLSRDWVVGPAKNGWLALNISAHDLPIDQPSAFYAEKSQNELNDYFAIGNEDRETSYFLPVFLSCYRAVEYLTQRPDWNQKTVFVHGSSQGGYLSLVTAGIHPKVTAMAGNVPAGCDHTGTLSGRAPGWPNWSNPSRKRDEAKTMQASRYYDAMNFARKIKCPSMIVVGLIDVTCPPEGIFSTVNQIQGPLNLIILPKASHTKGFEPYFPALSKAMDEAKAK